MRYTNSSLFRLICLAFLLLPLILTKNANSQTGGSYSDLENKQNKAFADVAERLCSIPIKGSVESVELSGKVKAELEAFLKKLADLGINVGIKYQKKDWEGPIQDDIYKIIKEGLNCSVEIMRILKDKTGLAPTPQANVTVLSGTIFDDSDSKPIKQAKIMFVGRPQQVITDDNGFFKTEFEEKLTGELRITVFKDGYISIDQIILPKQSIPFFMKRDKIPTPPTPPIPVTPSTPPKGSSETTDKNKSCLYGAIEIGYTGVKPVSIDRCKMENKAYEERNLNVGVKSALEGGDVESVIKEIFEKMQKDNIPKEHIYIVGSSSIADVPHKDKIKEIVEKNTGKVMDFINARQETKLEFDYFLSLLYPYYQKIRKEQVLMIDIGGGNIKGCYYEKDNINHFEISSYGTKEFTRKVNAECNKKSDCFKKVAAKLRKQELNQEISDKMLVKSDVESEFLSRERIYLTGGIVWAMVTLIRPGEWVVDEISPKGERIKDWKNFKVIKAEYIAKFYEIDFHHPLLDIKKYPNMNHIENDKEREEWREKVRKVKRIFPPSSLIAGAEILKALSDKLDFEDKNKTLFFAKEGSYAWIFGYLKEKIEKENSK